jgi:hypothetical protein
MLSQWINVDVDSSLGSLHHVNVGGVANVLKIHATFVFRVEVLNIHSPYFTSTLKMEAACTSESSAILSTFTLRKY